MKNGKTCFNKKTFLTARRFAAAAMIVILSLFAYSCQKEEEVVPDEEVVQVPEGTPVKPEGPETVLFDFGTESREKRSKNFEVNSTRVVHTDSAFFGEEKLGYTIWPMSWETESNGGIKTGESLHITIPNLEISREKYETAAVEFRYLCSTTSNDTDIKDIFRAYITTDKGLVISLIRLSSYVDLGTMDYSSSSEKKHGPLYKCVTEDLFRYLPEGETITSITLMPYGEAQFGGAALPSNGFRLVDLKVVGNYDFTAIEKLLKYENIIDIQPEKGIKSNFKTNCTDTRELEIQIQYGDRSCTYAVWANTPSDYLFTQKMNMSLAENTCILASDYTSLNLELMIARFNDGKDGLATSNMRAFVYVNGAEEPISTTIHFEAFEPGIDFVTDTNSKGTFYRCVSDNILTYLAPNDVISNIMISPYETTVGEPGGAFRLVEYKLVGQKDGEFEFLYAPNPDLIVPEEDNSIILNAPAPETVDFDWFPSIDTVILVLFIVLVVLVAVAYLFVLI